MARSPGLAASVKSRDLLATLENRSLAVSANGGWEIEPMRAMMQQGGEAVTYNRMEAKVMAGEHCRFCGRERAPLVTTRCCEQWICCDTAFVSFRGGRYCQFAHENESACYFHYNEGHPGSLRDCGECRRFFGEDEFQRRRKGRGK